ncbi:MAG: DUF58 domain-containing protein [Nitrospinae bacterium]|nr:DUF58 domain-containing protein [Nitrospinota bacterium]
MGEKTTFDYDPEVLSRIASLNIRATNLVEGLLSGHHRSRHKGSSVEFAEYKDYNPGDEIKHIDWKVVGKTDKYYVKQFEQSTNLKATILLDASGSMAYESPNPQGAPKMDYACTLVAALSYLLLKQYDAVGLALFNDRVVTHIPPRSKPAHFQHILHGLATLTPNGNTRLSEVIANLVTSLPSRGILILVSDFLTKETDIEKNLKLLVSRGLEVILFHILDPDEVSLPFEGDIVFESLEDDPTVGLDPADVREAYQREIQRQIKFYRTHCAGLGVDYVFLETSTPLEQGLSYYLLRRKSLIKT